MAKLRVDKIAAPIVKDEFTGSVHFDGTGDYLQTTTNVSDFQFGSGDFTIESWFYKSANGSNNYDGLCAYGDSGTQGWFLEISDARGIVWWSASGIILQYDIDVSKNTWHHVSVTRSNGTNRLFLNGNIVVENTTAVSVPTTGTNFYVGYYSTSGNYYFNGYISNLRICKGHAVYTGNFTPPTRELEVHTGAKGVVFPAADNRTVLLACQSSTDATAEASGRHIITAAGNATAADANPGLFRKTNITSTITENTGSVFFDGTGDHLKIRTNDDFVFGTGDFTIEFWVYLQATGQQHFYEGRGNTSTNTILINVDGSTQLSVYLNGDYRIQDSSALTENVWHHVALARNGSTTTLYKNGVSLGTYSDSINYAGPNTNNLFIAANAGTDGNGASQGSYVTGYLSNLRICKGHAVYTENFAPPTRELEVHEGPDDDRTVFLGLYDGENIFADKTGRHIIAAYGDRTSSPTPTATDSPIGSTTVTPGLTRSVDATAGPTFQGGVGFVSQNWLTLPKGTTTERYAGSNSASPAPRGLRGSGQVAPNNAITNTVDSVEIATTGDALDFGDLITSKFGAGGIGSPTRGLFCGGGTPTRQTAIDYFTISTRGNGQDFGDIFGDARTLAGATGGNETRGLTFGGATSSGTSNVICAITISSTGSVSDFGDCTKQNGTAVVCSPTRAVAAGGDSAANGSHINTIDYVTIQTFGNSFDFGDLSAAGSGRGVSSATRGLFSTGAPSATNTINYVTIATTSNSVDFGDLISNNISGGCASYSSLTRGCFAGLRTPTVTNTIEYFTISTLGDALNFGDLTQSVSNGGGLSNGHGGLG